MFAAKSLDVNAVFGYLTGKRFMLADNFDIITRLLDQSRCDAADRAGSDVPPCLCKGSLLWYSRCTFASLKERRGVSTRVILHR